MSVSLVRNSETSASSDRARVPEHWGGRHFETRLPQSPVHQQQHGRGAARRGGQVRARLAGLWTGTDDGTSFSIARGVRRAIRRGTWEVVVCSAAWGLGFGCPGWGVMTGDGGGGGLGEMKVSAIFRHVSLHTWYFAMSMFFLGKTFCVSEFPLQGHASPGGSPEGHRIQVLDGWVVGRYCAMHI